MSWSSFFQSKIIADKKFPDLLGRQPSPCHDCAIVCGLYHEIVEALKKEPKEVREAVTKKWFCHNNPTLQCAGALR